MRLRYSVEAQRLLPYCCQEWSKGLSVCCSGSIRLVCYGSDNIFDHHFYSSTVRRLSAKTLFLRKLDAKDVSGQAAHVWKLRSQPVDRLTTTLITKLLANQLAQSRPTADAGDQSPASGPAHHKAPTVDCMKDDRFESPEPHLLRRLSDIRPQDAPNISSRFVVTLARVVHIATSRTLSPDNQLLINSQAVYRPSLVENSRVTMSSVEQRFT
jgi:hypothetical protein